MTNRLSLATCDVAGNQRTSVSMVETRCSVDGTDLLTKFDGTRVRRGRGISGYFGADPDELFGPDGPLIATADAREVRIGRPDCVEECCGSLYVRVRREGDVVIWDGWRDTGSTCPVPFGEFRFSADDYDAEVRRAGHDRSGEWPARAVSRTILQRLNADSTALDHWGPHLHVFTSGERRGLVFVHIRETTPGTLMEYSREFPVTDAPTAVQADRIIVALAAEHPNEGGER